MTSTSLSRDQYEFLVDAMKPQRVRQLRGNSHLEQWDVRRHLIRCFGFGGFDVETKALDCVAQIQHTVDKDGKPIPEHKPRWTVVYRAEVRLTVKAPNGTVLGLYEDGATGDSQNQPSLGDAHDQAMKTALSQALKRCAVNLGDQFGLSLYNGGKTDPVVHRSLVAPDGAASAQPMSTDEVQAEPGAPAEVEPHEADEPFSDPDATEAQTAKFAELAAPLTAAKTDKALRSAWAPVVEAYKADQITTRQANALRADMERRKAEVAA